MSRIGNVPAIIAVKEHLQQLQKDGLIKEWSLPFEELLTRLGAAIFFLTPADEAQQPAIWQSLQVHEGFQYTLNDNTRLSPLPWKITFGKAEE